MFSLLLILFASSAVAEILYFYPPDDSKWISGRSYISQGTAATAVPLTKDTTLCGWYKASIPSSSPLLQYSQFWLGKAGSDRIGPNGRWSEDFDPEDDFNSVGGVFRLGEKFAQLGTSTLYFVADELNKANQNAGWYTTMPTYINDKSRCQFELAALIYDTDISVHPDFSCAEYYLGGSQGNGKDVKANCTLAAPYSSVDAYTPGGNLKGECTGVRRGIVQPTLDSITRKIKYNAAGDKWKCWTSEDWFNKAFKPTDGVNVTRCYDMPFNQVANGNFEFDSDKMLNANGRLVGGFFPQILTNTDGADYSKCPNCGAKRPFQSFAPLIKQITPEIFDNYIPRDGDFDDGDNPPRTRVLPSISGSDLTSGVWNWANISDTPHNLESETREGLSWYLHGTTAIKGSEMAPVNGFFCFESHTSFVYDPEQTFVFRGDDDIWVYINNKLVIDLGGTHLAAPGKVRLDTLGLIDGKEYPIDIFFCDRRSTMSNVRINTNMYVAQKSNFYLDQKSTQSIMCASITGADCASVMAGNLGSEMCGSQLLENGYTIDFYMVNRVSNKDTVWLSGIKNEIDCRGDDNSFSCFSNGIRVENGVYKCGGKSKCKGDAEASAKVVVNGNFNVYSRLMNKGKPLAGSKPILIDNIRSDETTPIIPGTFFAKNIKASSNAGTILLENLPTGAKVEVYNLQGKLIYTSGKSLNRENLGSDNLRIPVQTKGMYIIKVSLGSKTLLTFNRSIYE